MELETPIVALGEVLWDLLPTGRRAGGAPFNFAFHCQQLGYPAIIVSRVGDDDLGRELRAEVRRLGMSDEFIQTDPVHPTGTVQVEVGPDGQPTFAIADDVAWDYVDWEPQLEGLAQRSRVVCYGTLAQRRTLSRETIRQFLRWGARSLRVCDVNLRPPYVSAEVVERSVAAADWVKLNDGEVGPVLAFLDRGGTFEMHTAGGEGWTTADLLFMASQAALVCVTRGADGCLAATSTGEKVDVPGIPIPVADTVGAGDAFTAALLCRFLQGEPLERAAVFANAYAAIVASRPGGTPRVELAEVERLL